MVFGEGLPSGLVLTDTGQYVDYLAGALDIVAHELTHGLTVYSSRLIYRNESGALDEAFADIVGTSVEFTYQPPGSGARQADYLLGEDVFRPGGVRSLSNPGSFGDPDHYSRRYTGDEEGGVHINAGIPNQAFYLAIEGGVNRTSNLRVTGVGAANRNQIEKVFYRAMPYEGLLLCAPPAVLVGLWLSKSRRVSLQRKIALFLLPFGGVLLMGGNLHGDLQPGRDGRLADYTVSPAPHSVFSSRSVSLQQASRTQPKSRRACRRVC